LRRLAFEAELLRADIFSLRLAFVPVSDLKQRSGRSWASRRHRLAPCSVPGRQGTLLHSTVKWVFRKYTALIENASSKPIL
jgi:hypothetical protein